MQTVGAQHGGNIKPHRPRCESQHSVKQKHPRWITKYINLAWKNHRQTLAKNLCFWASQSLRARYFQALLEHWPGKCIATSTKHTRRMHTKYIEIWPKAPVNFERHLPNRAKFRGFPTSLTRTLEARPLLNSDHLWLFRTIWHPFVVGIWEKIDPDFEQLLIFQQSQIYINLLTFQTWKRCLAGND